MIGGNFMIIHDYVVDSVILNDESFYAMAEFDRAAMLFDEALRGFGKCVAQVNTTQKKIGIAAAAGERILKHA